MLLLLLGKLEINDLGDSRARGGGGGVECEKNLGRSTAILGSETLILRQTLHEF